MSEPNQPGPLGRAPLSAAVEDYLKTIFALRQSGMQTVSTQSLAQKMGVAAPSATNMCKRLTQMGLALHTPYYGIELTAAGEKIALEVIRHHRVLETYLAQILGLPWDKVHDEAERLEHVLSEELEARMMEALGHPKHDPHGAPIPSTEGKIQRAETFSLDDATQGTVAQVVEVDDGDAAILRHLSELNLVPGARLQVLRARKVEGVVWVKIGGKEVVVGEAPARAIRLKFSDESSPDFHARTLSGEESST